MPLLPLICGRPGLSILINFEWFYSLMDDLIPFWTEEILTIIAHPVCPVVEFHMFGPSIYTGKRKTAKAIVKKTCCFKPMVRAL